MRSIVRPAIRGRQNLAVPVRFWLVVLLLVSALLASCRNDTVDSTEASEPANSAYASEMLAQGYVEMVGDDLAAASLPPEPSQVDLGAEVYRQICLACHGDWGQGLTDAWRQEWGEDSNCWQSRCHAANHPPQGFQLPETVPGVLGPGSFARFSTAAELHEYIASTMPWWNPGSLSEEQAWQVTAYLMDVRQELDSDVTLEKGNAAAYDLRVAYVAPPDPRVGVIALVSLLGLATVTYVRRSRKS
jgi:cytochrome c